MPPVRPLNARLALWNWIANSFGQNATLLTGHSMVEQLLGLIGLPSWPGTRAQLCGCLTAKMHMSPCLLGPIDWKDAGRQLWLFQRAWLCLSTLICPNVKCTSYVYVNYKDILPLPTDSQHQHGSPRQLATKKWGIIIMQDWKIISFVTHHFCRPGCFYMLSTTFQRDSLSRSGSWLSFCCNKGGKRGALPIFRFQIKIWNQMQITTGYNCPGYWLDNKGSTLTCNFGEPAPSLSSSHCTHPSVEEGHIQVDDDTGTSSNS